ncbi:MAG TPA: hypothetical protein VKP30_15060 [Polyangiaceae bacterium]|nr:hypothetical protein [Polyangiaceae bacterium]
MLPRTRALIALAAAALGVIGLVPSSVWAQPTTRQNVDLEYDVDPSLPDCPTATEFRAIISDELGYDPHLASAPTRVAVRVRSTATGLVGEINSTTIANRRLGERRFTARSGECQRMVANLGFAVAVQLQLAAEQEQETASSEDPGAHANVSASRNGKSEALDGGAQSRVSLSPRHFEIRAPQPHEATRWIFSLGIGPEVGIGVGPNVAGVGRLFGAVRRGWFGLELGAEASLPSTKRESYGGGFRYQLSSGTFAACICYRAFSACGLGKLGQLQVKGVGLDVVNTTSGLVASVGPRVAYALDLHRSFFVQGHVETLVSPKLWTVNVNHVAVWTLPRLAVFAGIDFGARFR